MDQEIKKSFCFDSMLRPQLLSVLVLSGGLVACLSLAIIAERLGPINRLAKSWNTCVDTTASFLMTMPSFRSAGKQGIEAMSVSLCNGSTPQRTNQISPNE